MSKRLARRALAEARDMVGVMESGGNNRGKRVAQIIRANGGTGPEPWCGDFVAWCYRRAGSTAVQRAWAAVRFLGRVRGTGIVRKPIAGGIVVFDFPGGAAEDHTGIVVTVCNQHGVPVSWRKATHVKTIEGNTGRSGAVSDSRTGGDGVYVKIRELSTVAHWVRVYR